MELAHCLAVFVLGHMTFGLPIAFAIKGKTSSWLGLFSLSFLCGVFGASFIQLSIGYLGFSVYGPFAWAALCVFFAAGLWLNLDDEGPLLEQRTIHRYGPVDFLLVGVVICFLVLSVYYTLHNYMPKYDEYSIWLSNAKHIYQSSFLRSDFTVMDVHYRYTSFFTLPIVTLYHIYGGISETSAATLTALYPAFTLLYVYDERRAEMSSVAKITFILMFLACALSFSQGYLEVLFTSYIDVQLAVLLFVLLYIFLGFSSFKFPSAKWIVAIALLSVFWCAKQKFEVFALAVMVLSCAYGLFFHRDTWKKNIPKVYKSFNGIALGLFIVALILLNVIYWGQFGDLGSVKGDYSPEFSKTLKISRLGFLIKEIALFYPGATIVWVSILLLARYSKKMILVSAVFFAVLGIYVGVLWLEDSNRMVLNGSLFRYVGLAVFLIPLGHLCVQSSLSALERNFLLVSACVAMGISINNSNLIKPHKENSMIRPSLVDNPDFRVDRALRIREGLTASIPNDAPLLFLDSSNDIDDYELILAYFLQERKIGGEVKWIEKFRAEELSLPDDFYVLLFDASESSVRELCSNFRFISYSQSLDFAVFRSGDTRVGCLDSFMYEREGDIATLKAMGVNEKGQYWVTGDFGEGAELFFNGQKVATATYSNLMTFMVPENVLKTGNTINLVDRSSKATFVMSRCQKDHCFLIKSN